MAQRTDCLDDIVGLSTLECECEELQAPSDAQVSESGLYIDSLLNDYIFKLLQKGIDCTDNENIWVQLQKAKEEAIQKVFTNISACISNNYEENRNALLCNGANCTVTVGESKKNAFLTTMKKNYVVLKVTIAGVGGGVFSLHKVGLYPFQKKVGNNYVVTPLTKNVFVFDENAEFLGEAEINTSKVSARYFEFTNENGNAEPLQVCLKDKECSVIYLIYELEADERPMKNDTNCGCGSGNSWQKKKKIGFNLLQTDEIDEEFFRESNAIVNCSSKYKLLASITFEASVSCDYNAMVCDMVKNANSATYRLVAELIQYQAALILIQRIRMNRSQKFGSSVSELIAIQQSLLARYNELNQSVCAAFDVTCYSCLKKKTFIKSRNRSFVKR